jgi:hypothetical protein
MKGDQTLKVNKSNMQIRNPSKSTEVLAHAPNFSCILYTLTDKQYR